MDALRLNAEELKNALLNGDLDRNQIDVLIQFGKIKLEGHHARKPATASLTVRIPVTLRHSIDASLDSETLTTWVTRALESAVVFGIIPVDE